MHIRKENERRRETLEVRVPGKMHMIGTASFLQALSQEGEQVPPQNPDNEKRQSRSTGSIITIMFSPKLDSCLRRGYLTSFF